MKRDSRLLNPMRTDAGALGSSIPEAAHPARGAIAVTCSVLRLRMPGGVGRVNISGHVPINSATRRLRERAARNTHRHDGATVGDDVPAIRDLGRLAAADLSVPDPVPQVTARAGGL